MAVYYVCKSNKPNEKRTFFSKDEVRQYLVNEGCVNGPTGWRRFPREGEVPTWCGLVYYRVNDHRGYSVII